MKSGQKVKHKKISHLLRLQFLYFALSDIIEVGLGISLYNAYQNLPNQEDHETPYMHTQSFSGPMRTEKKYRILCLFRLHMVPNSRRKKNLCQNHPRRRAFSLLFHPEKAIPKTPKRHYATYSRNARRHEHPAPCPAQPRKTFPSIPTTPTYVQDGIPPILPP